MKENATRQLWSFLILVCMIVLGSCKDAEETPAVEVTRFLPASAFKGDVITIQGKHFSTTPANNQVSFNGATANVTSATSTSLSVTVPPDASSGKITVSVNGTTATSGDSFTILETNASGFAPASGLPGTTVTLTGVNFTPGISNNEVQFNGVQAEVLSATESLLTVKVPAQATTGKITIVSGGRSVSFAEDFVVLHTTITGFNPTSGRVGTSVTVSGTNFSTVIAENIVKFDDVTATVAAATSTQLTVIVPDEAVSGKISVSIDGVVTTSASDFVVLLPVISSFEPATAPTGTEIIIHGLNFSTVAQENVVKFISNEPATVVSATTTALTVVVPRDAYSGKVSVSVNGKETTSEESFVITGPGISEVFPLYGAPSVVVTITGTNFSPIPEFNDVAFNGIPATVLEASGTQLKVTVPPDATTGKISVSAKMGMSYSQYDFTICESTELVLSDGELSDISADKKSFKVSFKLTNVGAVTMDLANIGVKVVVSPNAGASGADPAPFDGDIPDTGTLSSGESMIISIACTLDDDVTLITNPHVNFRVYAIPPGSITECSTANNIAKVIYE